MSYRRNSRLGITFSWSTVLFPILPTFFYHQLLPILQWFLPTSQRNKKASPSARFSLDTIWLTYLLVTEKKLFIAIVWDLVLNFAGI